jgi:hypothetical protein
MHATALGSALVAALGVAVVLRWLPGRAAAGPTPRVPDRERVAA